MDAATFESSGVYPLSHCVKIGDTPSNMGEGINAEVWTIGITATGNEVGLSEAEWEALPVEAQVQREREAAGRLTGARAFHRALARCVRRDSRGD